MQEELVDMVRVAVSSSSSNNRQFDNCSHRQANLVAAVQRSDGDVVELRSYNTKMDTILGILKSEYQSECCVEHSNVPKI